MFQDFARAMDPALAMPIRRSRNPALTWEQAMQETLKLHPDKTIITKLKDVTCEEDLDPVLMTSTVFLARLARPHPYVFRNAWYLEVSLAWSSISWSISVLCLFTVRWYYTHTRTCTQSYTRTHACAHTHTHTIIHTHTHTIIYNHTHNHTHTQSYISVLY